MKKVFLSIVFLMAAFVMVKAQNVGTSKLYKIGELDQMSKLELTNVYIADLQKLNALLPYIAFNQFDANTDKDMGIPKTNYNMNSMKKLDAATNTYNDVVGDNLQNIAPYSDKNRIINAIMFLQRAIASIESGLKYEGKLNTYTD